MSTTSGIPASLLSQLSPQISTTGAATSNSQIDQDGFLKLFVAQLQNQDPESPQDASQLTSQLAQLTSVQQLTGINDRLDKLEATTKSGYGASLLSLVGKDVTFDASKFAVQGGEASRVNFKLAADAANVIATIKDANGNPVRTAAIGDLGAGDHTFAWDAKNTDGTTAADGNYSVAITANINGTQTPLAVTAQGTVDGVDLSSDPPQLTVNGTKLSIDQVEQVLSGSAS